MTWPVLGMAESLALLTADGAPFAMETVEVRGVPVRAYRAAVPDLRTLLDRSRAFGARDFLVYGQERVGFEAHWRAAHAFGAALVRDFGVAKGDRVALALRNYPEWSVCAFGALAVGAIIVPLNAWETGANLAAMLRDSGATVAVVDGERLERLAGEEHPARLIRTRCDGTGVAIEDIMGPSSDWAGLPDEPAPDRALQADDPATLFYTSGTTGAAKGVLGTHRNIATNIVNASYRAARAAVRRSGSLPPPPAPGRVQLLPLPLFHVTGFHSTLVPALANGTTVVLMYKWNLEEALALIPTERVNALGLVPTLATQIVDALEAGADVDVGGVDLVGYGGSAAAPALAGRVRACFPAAWPGQGYGATETSSLIASNSHEDMLLHPDSVGPAVPCTDIRIVSPDGADIAPGQPGELWARGPQIAVGYWNRPEATAEAFVDGWYRTGDVVTVDAEGFIRVVDRLKDMIIRGGENIYCAEVEAVLNDHPAIAEAAVFGMPDPVFGEIVAAVVRLEQKTPPAEILAHCAGRLSAFKVPAILEIAAEPFPRNAAEKIVKREIRARLLGEREAAGA